MKKFIVAIVGLLVVSGISAPAQASQGVAKKYSSCADLLEKYPKGVAKNKKARNTAVKGGFAKPKVSASLYKRNGSRLDRDEDGVMCEQQQSRRSNSFAEIQFLWGFLRAEEIGAPQSGACRDVSLVFDVRNEQVLPLAVDIQLADEFAIEYAFKRVMTDTLSRGKHYGNALRLCGNEWVGPHLTSEAIFGGVQRGDYYLVATELSLAGTPQSNTRITFK